MEGAATGGSSGEAQSVGRGGVGHAVSRRHWVPLTSRRDGNATEVEKRGQENRTKSG